MGATGLAEIDVAGQFTDDDDVQAGDDLRAQGGGGGQLRVEDGRAQVGKETQTAAQAQQATLGAHRVGQGFPLGAAHRAEQDGIGLPSEFQGGLRQGATGRVDGRAAHQGLVHVDIEAVLVAQAGEDLDRLVDDLRANAVTRQDQNLFAHVCGCLCVTSH